MRRLSLSTTITGLIIATVAAMVGYGNWRESRRARIVSRADTTAVVSRANALLRDARVTGKASLAYTAEDMLNKALASDPGNYEAARMLGSVYLSQHRFDEAVKIGDTNRAERPYDPVNYGVIGDGYLELGEYERAFDAFDRMMALRPSAASYARVAYARELQGNLTGALEAMRLAADATDPSDREGLAWAHAQVGEVCLQLSRVQEAKTEFSVASSAFPGHPFAVIGYAKALVAEGDLAGALTLLEDVQRRAPTPDLAARIGDLLARLGRVENAERQYARAEAMWREDAPEPKNLVRFLATHDRKLDEAIAIGERAARSRHDIFTEDALAWAYFKAGRVDAARKAIDLALRTGTRDREIVAHAAAIRGRPSVERVARR